ncbi:MAG: DUF4838 domain-containing protein, partial [Candidatus Hydrogenedentes bacterium]|nr:DUF4838 domain-containing protein [Candidatus Hydrogenedentota bacterium]
MNPRNTVTETGRRNTGSKSLFIGTMILVACFTAKGAELRVVSGTSAAEPVQFAATELCKYFGEATGLFPETQTVASLANENVLILTQSDMEEMDLRHPADDDEDAYRIYSTGNGALAFAGRSPRAVLYAVYDFLENELGYRWYFPYPEDKVTPRLSSEALNALLAKQMDREATPAFSFREREFRDVMPLNEQTDTRIVQQIDWWAKLRMNRFLLNFGYALDEGLWKRWKATLIPEIKKRGLLLGLGEHGSYPLFLPPARYARNHPEWYCDIDGRRVPGFQIPDGGWAQFCTSNPDAVNAYLNNFAAFIGANPEVDFYYPAPNDVSKWCECALCRDVSIADRYMRLDNQIAVMFERVKPGTRIMHLAYANHRLPPENTLPHPMIDVDIACWGRDLAYPLCDPRTMPEDADYLDVFRQWKEICGRVPGSTQPRVLYHCKLMRHYWLGLHLMPLAVIDDDFACAQDLGLDGFDFPLGFVGIWTKALNTYVVANKCWDPATPARTWTDRFFIDCYGDDANTLQQVYALTEDAFSDLRYGASRTLAWHPATLAVRENQIEGLGANARNAVAKLHEALGIVDGLTGANAEVAARLAKLSKVIRRARDEQEVLVKLDAL